MEEDDKKYGEFKVKNTKVTISIVNGKMEMMDESTTETFDIEAVTTIKNDETPVTIH